MVDEFSILTKLIQSNPAGKTRDSKEIPVSQESPKRKKGGKKKEAKFPSEPDEEREETAEDQKVEQKSGKVVDIVI